MAGLSEESLAALLEAAIDLEAAVLAELARRGKP